MTTSEITIRQLTDSDDLIQLTRLLNTAYKPLAEQGMKYLASHQGVDVTKKRIKNAVCFVAYLNEQLIGTITYYDTSRAGGISWYDQDFVATYGQFAVDPDLQKTGIGSMLIETVETLALKDGAREIAIDTSEHASDLIAYYKKRGYREVATTKWKEVNYRSVILSKKLLTNLYYYP